MNNLVTALPNGIKRTQKRESKVSLINFSTADLETITEELKCYSKETHRKNTWTTQRCSALNQHNDESLWGDWTKRNDTHSICFQRERATWSNRTARLINWWA